MSASIDELLARYAAAAIEHHAATDVAASRRANRAADIVAQVYAEPRELGPDAQNALLVLLDHPDPAVRGWAGAHTLDFAPDQGVPILENLSHEFDGAIGFNAETTLEVWRAGQLRFP